MEATWPALGQALGVSTTHAELQNLSISSKFHSTIFMRDMPCVKAFQALGAGWFGEANGRGPPSVSGGGGQG